MLMLMKEHFTCATECLIDVFLMVFWTTIELYGTEDQDISGFAYTGKSRWKNQFIVFLLMGFTDIMKYNITSLSLLEKNIYRMQYTVF